MSLRTANILVALFLFNGAAIFAGAMPVTEDIGYQPTVGGDEQIDQATQEGKDIQSERSSLDQFVGGILAAASALTVMFGVVTAGPQMLINLGAPPALVTFISTPIYAVIGLDLYQTLSGRDIL